MSVLGCAALALSMLAAPAGDSWVIVISGVGGDAEHRAAFVEAALSFVETAEQRYGVPPEQTRYLAERADLAPEGIDGSSRREQIERVFAEVAADSQVGDQILVLLIGHGSEQGGRARFNIPGPDLGPVEFDALLDSLADRRVAFVNTTSASGAFLAPLSAAGRTIVTSTRGGQQRDEPIFLRHFIAAFVDGAADTDKDERVSILEAFRYASLEVQREYETEGLILTEHALLDDNGDGEGTRDPAANGSDGRIAHAFALGAPVAGAPAIVGATDDPEVAALLERRVELNLALDLLRARKDELDEDEYLRQLEDLLVEVAEIDAAIRAKGDQR